MAKLYGVEKSKFGGATGTIIVWSSPIQNDVDADAAVLPGGYLRCDGRVYQADSYPELAELLGTGENCIYKKADTTLDEDQFQVPDLGSKCARASTGGDIGIYYDTTVASGSNTLKRVGVTADIESTIGNTGTIEYTGKFTVPSQTGIALTGNAGWTIPSATEAEEISQQQMLPHAHFHNGFRIRVKPDYSGGDGVSAGQVKNYYYRPADVNPTAFYGGDACNVNIGGGDRNCANSCNNYWKTCIGPSSPRGSWVQSANNVRVNFTATQTYVAGGGATWASGSPFDIQGGNFYAAARNAEVESELTVNGAGTLHTHSIQKTLGSHNYQLSTSATEIEPAGLQTTVSINPDNDVKFDDKVAPFIVVEYLIKF